MKRLSVTLAALGAALAATDTSRAQGWVQLTAPSSNIGPIACSADGTRLLLAGGDWFDEGGGLYISHDSGATWTAANVPVAAWYAVASSADGTVLMATLMPGAIYSSRDSGATWSRAPLKYAWWQGVACSANGAALYAAASRSTNGSPEGIYASMDAGATWSQAGAPPPTTYGDWSPVACSADGTRVIAGQGPYVWISTNSGMNLRLACTLEPAVPPPGRPVRLRQPRLLGGRPESGGRRGERPRHLPPGGGGNLSGCRHDLGLDLGYHSNQRPGGGVDFGGGLRLGRRPEAGRDGRRANSRQRTADWPAPRLRGLGCFLGRASGRSGSGL